MTIKTKDIKCPTCGKPNTWTAENTFKPFCSDRCKLIDLGDWASGKNAVPGESVNLPEFPDDDDESK